jgi:hypothetical protein
MATDDKILPLSQALNAAAEGGANIFPADRGVHTQEGPLGSTERSFTILRQRKPGEEPLMLVITPEPNTPSR